jgi:hypothetical protein
VSLRRAQTHSAATIHFAVVFVFEKKQRNSRVQCYRRVNSRAKKEKRQRLSLPFFFNSQLSFYFVFAVNSHILLPASQFYPLPSIFTSQFSFLNP